MVETTQLVRGTKDLVDIELYRLQYIQKKSREIAQYYGFISLETPLFEFSKTFTKTLGEDSDIITKEMYSFLDKNGQSLTLRPEFTAPVARALLCGSLSAYTLPLKVFTTGAVFRYERPQKGRQRQFHQINYEVLGEAHPASDIEIIALAQHILHALDINTTTLKINSLANTQVRKDYRGALVTYFTRFMHDLSPENKLRLQRNPLRILDAKNDREIIANAPVITDFYTQEARDVLTYICNGLNELNIEYVVDPLLVRGLDYYTATVFEFVAPTLGAQNTLLAGGRYNDLIANMGGKATPAIGFAGGIERLALLCDCQVVPYKRIALIPLGARAELYAMQLAYQLRKNNFYIDFLHGASLKKRLKNAEKAVAALIFGEKEMNEGCVSVKDMNSGTQSKVSCTQITEYMYSLVENFDNKKQ